MARRRHKTVQAVAGTIRRRRLIPDGARVVVATSGGPDSVALAAILDELSGRLPSSAARPHPGCAAGGPGAPGLAEHGRGSRPRFEIVLAHLNHGLRPAAARDEKFVRRLARLWGLPLVVGKADVKGLARRRALGLEEAARTARYEFLERAAQKAGAALVAVGHQRQDQAETVLMNFLRGSGVRGLAGMPLRRPIRADSSVWLIRPLLEVGREELLDYLRARGLSWVEDETNRSLDYRRNRVRCELLPLLERRHAPGLGRRLAQMAEQFAGLQELLAGRAAVAWDDVVVSATGRAVEFRLDRLRAEGCAVAGEILLSALERLGIGRRAVAAGHLSAVWQVITSPAGGQTLQLPAGARITRLGRHLKLHKKR